MAMSTRELYEQFPAYFAIGYYYNIMSRYPDSIPPVRNQGDIILSCTMHAVVDALYARWYFEDRRRAFMPAVQELINFVHFMHPPPGFVTYDDNSGVVDYREDGWPNYIDKVFDYVKVNGVARERDYRFTGNVGDCVGEFPPVGIKLFCRNIHQVPINRIPATLWWSPVVVTLLASPSLQAWRGDAAVGIYMGITAEERAHQIMDGRYEEHCLLVVGVGLNNSFLLAKNSWGEDWGFHGYIKFHPNAIANGAYYAEDMYTRRV